MRSLIGKVIEIKNADLKNISDGAVNTSTSSVVLFNETKNFTVEKQKQATFNIINPRKVIFMGSGGDDDATTRAERREEELERRRKRKSAAGLLPVFGAAGGASGASGGGDDGDDDGGSVVPNLLKNGLAGLIGGITSKIPFFGLMKKLVVSLPLVVSSISSLMGSPFQPRRGQGGSMGFRSSRFGQSMVGDRPNMRSFKPYTKPTPGSSAYRMSGGSAASTSARRAGIRGASGLGGKLLLRSLGPISFAYDIFTAFMKSAEFKAATSGMAEEAMRNIGRQATATQKFEMQKSYKGHPARRYHEDAAIHLQVHGLKLYKEAKKQMMESDNEQTRKAGESLTQRDFLTQIGSYLQFKNPTLSDNARFFATSINELAGLHRIAAGAPESDQIIQDPMKSGVKQKVNAAMNVIPVLSQEPANPFELDRAFHNLLGTQPEIDDLGLGGAARGKDIDTSYRPTRSDAGREEEYLTTLDFLKLMNPILKNGVSNSQIQQSDVLFSDSSVLSTREPDTDIADQTIRTNHGGIDFSKSQYVD